MKTLQNQSDIYYDKANVYEEFSIAEDFDDVIVKRISKFANGNVLDLGCGTGKFLLKLIQSNPNANYTGLDISSKQLNILNKKISSYKNIKLVCADSCELPFEDNTFDFVFSSWVLGTMETDVQRNKALKEIKRVLKPDCRLLLIENWHNDEFEKIIRGYNLLNKIDAYDYWIKTNNFTIIDELNTRFHFESIDIARRVFSCIWNSDIASRIASNNISHKVRIYALKK